MLRLIRCAALCSALGAASCAPSPATDTPGTSGSVASASTANATPAPTGRALLREAAQRASNEALAHEATNWDALVAELEVGIPPDAPPEAAHDAIRAMLRKYGDPHARLVAATPEPPAAAPTAAPSPPPEKAPPAPQPAHPPIPTLPEGRMLPGRVAYLVLPGCPGNTAEERLTYAQALRRALQELEVQAPIGWVIDLRLNGGGNVWPMLAGLWPLLGDGVHATSVGAQGLMMNMGCDERAAWLEINGVRTSQQLMDNADAAHLLAPAPRAVLIGGWTMSSGELVAGALRESKHTRVFGEPTAGLTTITNTYYLSDGSQLLPVDRMCDRHGAWLGPRVLPDVTVEAGPWPLPDDNVAARATRWLTSEATPQAHRE